MQHNTQATNQNLHLGQSNAVSKQLSVQSLAPLSSSHAIISIPPNDEKMASKADDVTIHISEETTTNPNSTPSFLSNNAENENQSLSSVTTLVELQNRFRILDNQIYSKLTEYNKFVLACSNSFRTNAYLKSSTKEISTGPGNATSPATHKSVVIKDTAYWIEMNSKFSALLDEIFSRLDQIIKQLEARSALDNNSPKPHLLSQGDATLKANEKKERQMQISFLNRVKAVRQDHSLTRRDTSLNCTAILNKMQLFDKSFKSSKGVKSKGGKSGKNRDRNNDRLGADDNRESDDDEDDDELHQREHIALLDQQQGSLMMSLRAVSSILDDAFVAKTNLQKQRSMISNIGEKLSSLYNGALTSVSGTLRGIDYYQHRDRLILASVIAACMFITFLYLKWT